ncbi:hypothetical protein B6N60_02364 [Richelia sinica FACHB-800]|uniref:Uncharacterized protein n=1 Tax=Richelia sinica FACHB-800 TaxID=1357546 RepID=A0A975T7R3_9NOST|nr:hypothetical protein B6N60_02364 [Richelia sinica FACHB-800]
MPKILLNQDYKNPIVNEGFIAILTKEKQNLTKVGVFG